MACERCQGLMVQDDFFDLRESVRRLVVWRCVQCGEMVDPGIVTNRRRHLSGAESPAEVASRGGLQRPLTRAA